MKKLLLPAIAALALFATSASAEPKYYTEPNLTSCLDEAAIKSTIIRIAAADQFDVNVRNISKWAAENGCILNETEVKFAINELICNVILFERKSSLGIAKKIKTLSVAKVTMFTDNDGITEQFAILNTGSQTPTCR